MKHLFGATVEVPILNMIQARTLYKHKYSRNFNPVAPILLKPLFEEIVEVKNPECETI